MKSKLKLPVALIFVAVFAQIIIGQQRLLVVGGGTRPPEAVKKFVEWSGGAKARILIITWASGVPDESFEGLKKDFFSLNPDTIEHASVRPLGAEKRVRFVEQLKMATGVFFSGGDQNRIMDVLADEELFKLVREKYAGGTPFGGTSAGAAAMSDPMMTGDADLTILDGSKVGVRKGLGLIPNVIFDQHFLVRQRHNRLFGLIMKNTGMLGIGIDEDTAILIENNRQLTVDGKTQVMLIDAKNRKGPMLIYFLMPGERFDIRKIKRMKNRGDNLRQ